MKAPLRSKSPVKAAFVAPKLRKSTAADIVKANKALLKKADKRKTPAGSSSARRSKSAGTSS